MYIISKFNKSVNQKGSSLSLPAHGRAGARATSSFSCGAFCEAKNEIQRRRKSEGGPKFLPPSPLPVCPPERKLSKFSVRIFSEKSSDFVQDRQPISKVCVSRLARGFAPRFGKRIFKQFPNEPIFFLSPEGRP